ncbi:hypothetical protein, partial [Thiolapillus sp.]|uniref:hypothetical protein n=1 Tax=Thiolapillus sp. TaxID=2017437 RepID=UPI0025CC1783
MAAIATAANSIHPLADKMCGNHTACQACLRPRDRFWDIPVPKIDSAFDNLLVPQPSWSPSTAQQL